MCTSRWCSPAGRPYRFSYGQLKNKQPGSPFCNAKYDVMLQLPGGRVMQYGKGSCNSHLSEMLPARTDSVQKGSFHSVSCQSVHSVRLQTAAASGLTHQ